MFIVRIREKIRIMEKEELRKDKGKFLRIGIVDQGK